MILFQFYNMLFGKLAIMLVGWRLFSRYLFLFGLSYGVCCHSLEGLLLDMCWAIYCTAFCFGGFSIERSVI